MYFSRAVDPFIGIQHEILKIQIIQSREIKKIVEKSSTTLFGTAKSQTIQFYLSRMLSCLRIVDFLGNASLEPI